MNFTFGFSELENSKEALFELKKINDKNTSTISQLYVKQKLSDMINQYEVIKVLSILSLEMFKSKIDSESNEIANFFGYLIFTHKDTVEAVFKEHDYNISDYIANEEINIKIKNIPVMLAERLQINHLSHLSEGFINSTYITAGNKNDIIIYAPANSILYFTCTITYYDALVNISRYDSTKEGLTDRFVLLAKDQKIESEFTPFEATVFSYKPEIYKINLNNTFSWVNGKEIKYKYSILKLSNQNTPTEKHRLDTRYKVENFKEHILNKITEYVFFKYETFLGKNLEDYSKKVLGINYLNYYTTTWLNKFNT